MHVHRRLFHYRLVFGLENGLVVVDYLNQFILMNLATADLYGKMDPFQRATLSPKRRGIPNESNLDDSNIFSYEHQVSNIQYTMCQHCYRIRSK
jgi:hypothetical protein